MLQLELVKILHVQDLAYVGVRFPSAGKIQPYLTSIPFFLCDDRVMLLVVLCLVGMVEDQSSQHISKKH